MNMKTDMPQDYTVAGSKQFTYRDHLKRTATVWLRFFIRDEQTVIIFTDRSSTHVCPSITNSIEDAASALVKEFPFFLAAEIIWIEHYDHEPQFPRKHPTKEPETFDLVTFQRSENSRFYDPDWKRITREEAEKLAGRPITPEAPRVERGDTSHEG